MGVSWEEEDGRVARESFNQLAVQAKTAFVTGESSELKLNARWATHEIADYPDGSGGPASASARSVSAP